MSRNFLSEETSPYLLQHKDNPVHWRPWGEEALATAKAENKPILLSIGYAACHWCHVMAHESFEDDHVAAVMNRLYVNIKVDREERPDIDTIYMNALHMLGQRGGWPLTMFLTPDGEPFWGGTYFPKEPKFGQPGFIQVLEQIAAIFHDQPDKVDANRTALTAALQKQASEARPGDPTPEALPKVAQRILSLMDDTNGGIQGAPKFPQTFLLDLLWRHYLRSGEEAYRTAVMRALDHMCEGGIYDHLGGGFARYAVDEAWLVPHFEKMLYDNALLLTLLSEVWKETGKPLYARRVRETVEWVFREMTVEGGAFAASLDADSEGVEGKFYVWAAEEIDQVLGDDAERFKTVYGVSPQGNWEETNILNRLFHADTGISESLEDTLEPMKAALLAERTKRVRPGFDDKVLADWNGLMISALARAGAAFDEPDWVDAAARAFRFVTATMVKDGRLHHTYRAEKLQHLAMADDLAHMISAALDLHAATGEASYLDQAKAFEAELDSHYSDPVNGGYFFTADDAGGLITRTRSCADDATPAANGTLPGHFARLSALTGDAAERAKADAQIRAFAGEMNHNLFPLGSFLASFEQVIAPIELAIVGEAADAGPLLRAAHATAAPTLVISRVTDGARLPEGHPAHGKSSVNGRPAAYVCTAGACSLPITEPHALVEALKQARSGLPQ